MRPVGKEVETLALIGLTSLLFQQQNLGAHALADRIPAAGMGKRLL
jgi:hypothetical protein